MNHLTLLNVIDALAAVNQLDPQKFSTKQIPNQPPQKRNWYEYGDDYSNEPDQMKIN